MKYLLTVLLVVSLLLTGCGKKPEGTVATTDATTEATGQTQETEATANAQTQETAATQGAQQSGNVLEDHDFPDSGTVATQPQNQGSGSSNTPTTAPTQSTQPTQPTTSGSQQATTATNPPMTGIELPDHVRN